MGQELHFKVDESSAELTGGPLSALGLQITSASYQPRGGLAQVVVAAEAQFDPADAASVVAFQLDFALLEGNPRQALAIGVVTPNTRLSIAARCEVLAMPDGGLSIELVTAGHTPLIEEGEAHLPAEAVGEGLAGVLRLRFSPA